MTIKQYQHQHTSIYITNSVQELMQSVQNCPESHLVLVDNALEELSDLEFLVDLIDSCGPQLEMLLFNANSNVSRLANHEQTHLARFYSEEISTALIDSFVSALLEGKEALSVIEFKNVHTYPIYIFEHQDSLREVLSEYLQMQGFQVNNLNSIRDLEQLNCPHKNLILLDLQYPKLDPLTYFSKNALPENSIVLGLTSVKNKDKEERLLKLGIHAIVTKPIPLAKLSNLLDRLGQLDPTNRLLKASKLKKMRKRKRKGRTIFLSILVATLLTLILYLVLHLSFDNESHFPTNPSTGKDIQSIPSDPTKAYEHYQQYKNNR